MVSSTLVAPAAGLVLALDTLLKDVGEVGEGYVFLSLYHDLFSKLQRVNTCHSRNIPSDIKYREHRDTPV